jgi:hypothetical protein
LIQQTLLTCAVIVLAVVAAYLIVGAVALFLEQTMGQIALQAWEFYAVTATMFITLAFPGFVFRYLLKRRSLSLLEASMAN